VVESDSIEKIAHRIDGYDRGIYTLLEVGTMILESITPQNVADIYPTLPDEFQQYIKTVVKSEPKTDAEWDAAKYIHIKPGCHFPGCEPPVKTPDEEQAEMQEWKGNHRLRIEALRDFLDKD
tara:strand:- start:709 stop:1074 length:366 start_codon:yes stop_codon:yes gene_type:complete